MTFRAWSELFFTMVPEHIWEIAIQREHGVLHERIHAEMKTLDRLTPSGDMLESLFELRHVFHFDHERGGCETKLAPCEPPAFDQATLLEMAQVAGDLLAEFQIADTRLEITPGMVEVQVNPLGLTPAAITAAIGTAMPWVSL